MSGREREQLDIARSWILLFTLAATFGLWWVFYDQLKLDFYVSWLLGFVVGFAPKANTVVLCRYAPWKKIRSAIKGPIVGAVGPLCHANDHSSCCTAHSPPTRPMSALGQKRTWRVDVAMSALPPKADIPRVPSRCPLCAMSGTRAPQHRSRLFHIQPCLLYAGEAARRQAVKMYSCMAFDSSSISRSR